MLLLVYYSSKDTYKGTLHAYRSASEQIAYGDCHQMQSITLYEAKGPNAF